MTKRPRLLIAGTSSGVGKTTVMLALTKALANRGVQTRSFKCGPDYLDPTYHARASGQPCHNLDGWLMGRQAVTDGVLRQGTEDGISLIEGVMGLFDGADPTTNVGSAAEIADWLDCPVILVVDASGMARSVKALVQGFRDFDPRVKVKGVIANRLGSLRHKELIQKALGDIPLVGGLPKKADLAFPERYLGLKSAQNIHEFDALFQAWGELAEEWFDLDGLMSLAKETGGLECSETKSTEQWPCRIGIAKDEAFSFYYDDNIKLLTQSGAELIPFSPLHDSRIPEVDGLYLGGGYPETKAAQLSGNQSMMDSIREFAGRGGPIYGECGGMMYLTQGIRALDGSFYPMVGLLSGIAVMAEKLKALGYVEVETRQATPLGRPGVRFRGHQFRYSELEGIEERASGAYGIHRRRDRKTFAEGYHRGDNVLGSYVHAHWASNPDIPLGFAKYCHFHRQGKGV